jgi:nucleotide-binding universal stress UspA family protein
MFDKILVTMGLSSHTWSTIPYVRHLAIKFGSELHLLGVSSEPQKVWDQSLIGYVESISRSLQEDNILTKANFIHGNPAVEVVKYCDKNGIGLVATTAGNCNEITCTILSNIAKRMGITANTPLLIAPPSHSKEADFLQKVAFLKILVPLDCSQVGESVLPYVETIAKASHSSVSLLHVNIPPFRGVPIMHSEVIKISRSAGRDYIKKACKHLQDQGIEANWEVIDGTPVKTILKYANQNKIDLIAMGTHGFSGIEGWIFGNLTNKVSDRTVVPILTLTMNYPASGVIGVPAQNGIG